MGFFGRLDSLSERRRFVSDKYFPASRGMKQREAFSEREREMSLVDYASSSDEDDAEVRDEERDRTEAPKEHSSLPPPHLTNR